MKYDSPWPHMIVDDFLEKEDIDLLLKEAEVILELGRKPTVRHRLLCHWDCASNTVKSKVDLNEDIKISDAYISELDYLPKKYEPKLKKIYKQLKEKTPKHTSVLMELMICNEKFQYQIHDESPWKLLSTVTYISKDENSGTTMYTSEEDEYSNPEKKVEWLQNRCFIFSGEVGKTWHAFSSNGKNIRITLNLFLVREQTL